MPFPSKKPPHTFQTKKPVPPPPRRVYRDDELDFDIVEASFVDMRGVTTGNYPDGKPKIEYMSEKEAATRGFLDAWQKAEAIDKGLKHQEETG
ncbi:MAG: hypothetical protein AAB932_04915 [Patescibacteria group bacterium]